MKNYRQGDIVLKKVNEIPRYILNIEYGRVIAYGEATGHKHEFDTDVEIYRDVDREFIKVMEVSNLIHPEHNTLTIEPGLYEVIHEREYDYFAYEERRTED